MQFVGELGIALRIGIPRAGAFDGAGLDVLTAETQKTLGTGRGDLEIASVEISSKGRGAGGVERAVEFPAIAGPRGGEALGEVDLVNITGGDVVERTAGGGDELFAGEVGSGADSRARPSKFSVGGWVGCELFVPPIGLLAGAGFGARAIGGEAGGD